MHSPSISIFDAGQNAVCEIVSSTGFAATLVSDVDSDARFLGLECPKAQEVLYAPKGCSIALQSAEIARSTLATRERTESNKFSEPPHGNSNRKERQISALAPLLNWANTSGIRLFADPQRQSSAWTDDMVMDRGAEGAARGCDAV